MLKKNKQRGQSTVEYIIILSAIAIACLAAAQLMGTNLSAKILEFAATIAGLQSS